MLFKSKSKSNSRLTQLIVQQDSYTNVSEQFRTIRTNIQYSIINKGIKSIVITSARQGAGKSFAAANLAVTLASEKKRILLVDADFRRPAIHNIFKTSNNIGLCALLNDESLSVKNAVQYNRTHNLYILTSGSVPSNPSELLNSGRMDAILKELKNEFDFIIFDMPPVLAVTDAQIVAGKVDGTIFIIPKGLVAEEDVLKAKELLAIVNATIIGAIINKVEKTKKSYDFVQVKRANINT